MSEQWSQHVINKSTPVSYALVLELRINELNVKQDLPPEFFFQLLKQRNTCGDAVFGKRFPHSEVRDKA